MFVTMIFFHRFTKATKIKSKKNKGSNGFLWKLNPTMDEELVGKAFKRIQSGKRAKRSGKRNLFWHLNKDHDTMVLNTKTDKELKVKLIEEKDQVEWKTQDQDEDPVKKENGHKVIGPLSNEDSEGTCNNNENSLDVDENDKALDLSLSSCSSEILIFSESY